MSDIAPLRKRGHELMSMFDESLNWLKKTGNLDRHNKGKLEDAQRTVRKVTRVLDKKPVFGLFGRSQAGKSYLAHIILSDSTSSLKINLGKEEVDFIEDINPSGGGVESTGVVTRFTIDPVSDKDFPVYTRFLSLEDVCLVLCKSYYLNLQDKDKPLFHQTEDLQKRIDDVQTRLSSSSQQQGMSTRELEFSLKDLRNSLRSFFPQYELYWQDLENTGFWLLCEEHIGTLAQDPQTFSELLSVLWMSHPQLSELASKMFGALKTIGWVEQGRLRAESVLREGGAIVDVRSLREIDTDYNLDVHVEGSTFQVNRGVVSALTKEVVLNIAHSNKDEDGYLSQADILDFPGARSPIKKKDSENDITLPFLRGKVEHLFEQYSVDYEVNNLIFCVPDDQADVTELPLTLESWIARSIGKDPEARAKLIASRGISPLMVVFTMFDEQLKFDISNDKTENYLSKRWEKRFFTLFKNAMVHGNWDELWTPDSSFKHVFPLRNFTFSNHTFQGFDSDKGTAETHYQPLPKANDIYPTRDIFLEKMKDSFVSNEHCIEYLDNPEATWDSIALPGKNGSGPIVDAMQKAAASSGIAAHATNIMNDATKVLCDLMGKHYHSDDIAAMHNKAEELSANLERTFNSSVRPRKRKLLLELQSQIALAPDEVSDWLESQPSTEQVLDQNNIDEFLHMHPEVNAQMTGAECVEAFRIRYRLSGQDEARDVAWNEFNVDLNRLFDRGDGRDENPTVSKAMEHFAKVKLEFDDNRHSRLITLGMDADDLKALLSQLNHGLETRQMASRISEFLSGQPNLTMAGEVDALRMGALIAHHWNEYVFHLSGSFFTAEERTTLQHERSARDTNPQEVFDKMTEMFGSEPLANLPKVHFAPAHRTVMQWHKRLRNLFLVNCGFANYDMEQNEELGQILQRIERVS